MTIEQSLCVAEAIIFASGEGISIEKLQEVLELDFEQVQYIIQSLSEKYNHSESGIRFVKNTENVLFATDTQYSEYVYKAVSQKKNAPLSNAAMETLAIIAYNQPVSRAFVEQVRGVDSSSSIQRLLSRNLIEEAGRLDIPGKPISYRTTPVFLRSFSLESIEQLPKIKNNSLIDEANQQLNLTEEE